MKWKRKVESILFVVGCIFINYLGRTLSDVWELPVWLDSVGTVFAAYMLGPAWGAVAGGMVNVLYALNVPNALFYGLTNIAVGIVVGICGRKGFLKSIFGVLSIAFLTAVISTTISVVLNFLLVDGSTGNLWGDGVSELLQKMGIHKIFSCIIGEFYLDFLDKVLTVLLLFLVARIYRKRKAAKTLMIFLLILLQIQMVLMSGITVWAEENPDNRPVSAYDFQEYVQTVYNGENGLPGGMANDIAQTEDGVLWIGTYGGLYRYSGNTFEWMKHLESVKTVNCLYTDEAGRLWIGTNDNGLSVCMNEKITNVMNREKGLPSNSVRCITENIKGYYYVGTTDGLVILNLSDELKVCDFIPEIVYAHSICADGDRNIAAVTDDGGLYLLRDTEIVAKHTLEKEGESYNCCAFDGNGRLYAGTFGGRIEVYQVSEKRLNQVSEIVCGGLEEINAMHFLEDGELLICADNGIGYVNSAGVFSPIDTSRFNNSIDNMLMDYQGNLWFTSSRLGLLRLSPSVFSKVHRGEGKDENVVNTVIKWQDCLYIGTDDGLEVDNESHSTQITEDMKQELQGVRIRCLMADSRNHLWICTSGKGIYEVSQDGTIKNYNSKTGTLGDKFRSAIETKEGVTAVAGDAGITFIRDGKIIDTIGASEGLSNPMVLSLCEGEDGSIFAGTDGSGIAVIKDGRIAETLKQENGLSSEVVLRMVPDSDGGMFLVTGNGLCYMDEEKSIRFLDNFPYYNNYDIVEGNQGELFVLGSAGIYVVDKAQLLCGTEPKYELLNFRKGLQINLTPNSWNYVDEESNLYLSGNTGVVSLNMDRYDITASSYRMLLNQVQVDGEVYPVEEGEIIRIPRGAGRIEVFPELVNYSTSDPEVILYLEGFDREPQMMAQSEMTNIAYTNLPSGEYTFHFAVLDSKTGGVIAENTYRLIKEKEIYDNWWFKVYVGLEAAVIISYLTWLFFRTQIQKTLRIQKMELEWANRQLQMGNETILTIAQAVDAKDERTSKHSLRVSEYSVKIAKKLGYSDEACENLRKTALLHDIGKIGIPDRVLNKPTSLTKEEYALMKSHVERGAEILKNFTLIEHVVDGALYHHERYDGKGYVHGLKGEEIPLNARIIGIADAFDAMTANRVYRKKLELKYVLKELREGSGTQFDPRLVEIMLGLIEDGTIDVRQIYGTESDR
ncbi:MAG: HD domain-containing protein [Roseburia sp.]|nr:HD domain-containing protein [Roseburia sp.]